MDSTDFDLIKTLLGGTALTGERESVTKNRELLLGLADYALSQNWNFGPLYSKAPIDKKALPEGFKWAHIKTLRFCERHREDLHTDFLNLLFWEHSKRQIHLHPLVCLLMVQIKMDTEQIDGELLYRISQVRLPFILSHLNKKRLSELESSSVQFYLHGKSFNSFEDFTEKHPEYSRLSDWPLTKSQRSFHNVLKDFVGVPPDDYLHAFSMDETDWYKSIQKLSRHYPKQARWIVQNIVNYYHRSLLTSLYTSFKEAENDKTIQVIEWRPVIRAIKPGHAQSCIIDFIHAADKGALRHHSILQLATYNYYLWEENMVQPFIKYAVHLEPNKIWQKQWIHAAAWRFAPRFENTLCKQMEKHLSAERSYKLVPLLREQMLLQLSVRSLFNY